MKFLPKNIEDSLMMPRVTRYNFKMEIVSGVKFHKQPRIFGLKKDMQDLKLKVGLLVVSDLQSLELDSVVTWMF